MIPPPSEASSDRRAVSFTVIVLVSWVTLTVAAPVLAPLVSDVAVQLDPKWRVRPPSAEAHP